MDSTVAEGVKDSPQQVVKDTRVDDVRVSRSGSASAEVVRLQNVIRAKDKELDDVRKEVMALKATLNTKDRALNQSEQELRILKERNVATEGELANMAKELAVLKVDKRKLEAQLAGLARKGDKEQSVSTLLAQDRTAANTTSDGNGPYGTVPSSEHVASLQADLRMARVDGEKAVEGVKVLENLLRAKDKHINGLQRKADEVEIYRVKCADLENRLSEMNRQMDDMRAAARAATEIQRLRDAENSRLTADLAKARAALDSASDAAARSSAALKASELRCTALEQEVATLVGQLARTSAVAQRVAASEVKAGCKDEGVVHVTRHIEEIRFMGGEIARLQQRVTSLEKELAVADELKERYRRASSAEGSSRDSFAGSPCPTPGSRPSSTSRPISAPRRPVSASATTPRPASVPRIRIPPSTVLSGTTSVATASPPATAAVPTSPGSAAAAPQLRSALAGSARRAARPQPWNTPSPTKPSTPASPRVASIGSIGVASAAGSDAAASSKTVKQQVKPLTREIPGSRLPGTSFGRPHSAGSGPLVSPLRKGGIPAAPPSPRGPKAPRGTASGNATPRSAAATPRPLAGASGDKAPSPAAGAAAATAAPAAIEVVAMGVIEGAPPSPTQVAAEAAEAVVGAAVAPEAAAGGAVEAAA